MERERHLASAGLVCAGLVCALGALAVFAAPCVRADVSTTGNAPTYVAAGIVQAATQTPEPLAPNTIATIYGSNLSWTTYAVQTSDIINGELPTQLEGVSVLVNGIPCNLFYVSPGQINFLTPYEITTSSAVVLVVRQGAAGPPVTILMGVTAPAFFVWDGNLAVAEHTDGSLITPQAPAQSGEIIVLYAGGLGRTSPDIASGQVVSVATTILLFAQLQIRLNGAPCPASSILYAGLAPDFVGLYQINLRLPDNLPSNPEIRIAIGSQVSPASVLLPAQ
jgi:uncharacterized protein (TIGR03437 family)